MYLGEISRNILLHFIDLSLLFSGYSSKVLNTHFGYDAAFVSKIEGAESDAAVRKAILSDLGVEDKHVSDACVQIVRWACKAVADRASALAACAIVAVVTHTGNDKVPEGEEDTGVDVGLDGR